MIDILAAADRCVKCGMCLPHCPTYIITRNEADSPRGRISLMQALQSGELPSSNALVHHLDACLGCRACEVACPAAVPYGDLIDAARAKLQRQRTRRSDTMRALADIFIQRRWPRRLAYWSLFLYQRFGTRKIVRSSGLLRLVGLERAEFLLPRLARAAVPRTKRPLEPNLPKIALFTGCVAEILDRTTLNASQRVLTRLGYETLVPSRQTCCGALHLHNGLPDKALSLMRQNIEAFDEREIDAVISTASGCGAQLAEYPKYLQGEESRRFAKRHQDICQFLAEQDQPPRLSFKPLTATVAVHLPCSLVHVLKQTPHIMKLLSRIPNVELYELGGNTRCCGAAGSYMLHQPQLADELLVDKIEHLKSEQPDILVTSNIGCALHIEAGVRRAGLSTRVMHPVTLLDQQLVDH